MSIIKRSRLLYCTFQKLRSNFKRNVFHDNDYLKQLLTTSPITNSRDVEKIKNEIIKLTENFRVRNIDGLILNELFNLKKYDIALNYIRNLDETTKSKMHLYLANQNLRAYYFMKLEKGRLTEIEEDYILNEYRQLEKSFPILNSSSIESCILGLSITKHWEECVQLFKELKKIDRPSGRCYSAIIAAAFSNNADNLAWEYFEESFKNNNFIYDEVYIAYLDKLSNSNDTRIISRKLEKLLRECSEKNFIFSKQVVEKLNKILNEKNLSSSYTFMNKRTMVCENCGQKLENFKITNETFDILKRKIIKNVIIGKNIFSKTTPAELEKFENFVKNLNGYNVVIDGLNVAYASGTKKSPQVYSSLLVHVLNYFIKEGKKVVILGRSHMSKWPKTNWNFIKSNSAVFLTQDISQDDPYLLYTALHCGKDTLIVSRDLMRSHSFLLKDPNDKIMFSRWLAQRQYQLNYVRNDGRVFFKPLLPYCTVIQKNGENWHIPEEENNWLCIETNK